MKTKSIVALLVVCAMVFGSMPIAGANPETYGTGDVVIPLTNGIYSLDMQPGYREEGDKGVRLLVYAQNPNSCPAALTVKQVDFYNGPESFPSDFVINPHSKVIIAEMHVPAEYPDENRSLLAKIRLTIETQAGDVNGDGRLSVTDWVLARNIYKDLKEENINGENLTHANLLRADVNRDGKVSIEDIIEIGQRIAGEVSNVFQVDLEAVYTPNKLQDIVENVNSNVAALQHVVIERTEELNHGIKRTGEVVMASVENSRASLDRHLTRQDGVMAKIHNVVNALWAALVPIRPNPPDQPKPPVFVQAKPMSQTVFVQSKR